MLGMYSSVLIFFRSLVVKAVKLESFMFHLVFVKEFYKFWAFCLVDRVGVAAACLETEDCQTCKLCLTMCLRWHLLDLIDCSYYFLTLKNLLRHHCNVLYYCVSKLKFGFLNCDIVHEENVPIGSFLSLVKHCLHVWGWHKTDICHA